MKRACKFFYKICRIGTFISILLIAIATLVACSPNNITNQNNETKPEVNKKIEISMEEAIAIGMAEANKYYDNLKITEVHSYDNDYLRSINAGEDGKRQWWYVTFANEKNNEVDMLLVDGKIEEIYKYDIQGNNGLFDLSEIKLTAREAVQKAKELGLRGGNPDNDEEEWVSGFNFKLEYASLVKSPEDEKIFFEVIGISPNGNFAHVDFDATTGELLLAEEKIEHKNGDVEWKPFSSSLALKKRARSYFKVGNMQKSLLRKNAI